MYFVGGEIGSTDVLKIAGDSRAQAPLTQEKTVNGAVYANDNTPFEAVERLAA